MIKHQKPKAFYDTFEKKGPGQKVTHYCPGCGHGVVHKLIGLAIDELKIQDRCVLYSPVGCTVFAYYYFDVGNVQCAHGRAPAVATGMRRTLDDAILMCYQGDGDLAGIGTTEIIHSANRGENITVFFVNNAIYGMTGGQMAPTTLLGQKTTTTPSGRTMAQDGAPICMAEIMNAIKSPVYIERVSLSTPAKIQKARKAIKKALQYQKEKRGFSFVEILSPCPINWKMAPVEAKKWLKDYLEPVFEVKKFRDIPETEGVHPQIIKQPWLQDNELLKMFRIGKGPVKRRSKKTFKDQFIKISGFGGQGVMSAGVVLAHCAISEGLNSTWLPSYGPEMRGGTANASVIISNQNIGSPLIDQPNVLIAMNIPSLNVFENTVQPGGIIMVNSSIISQKVARNDVKTIYVPASELAHEVGFLAAANMVMVSLFIIISGIFNIKTLRSIIPQYIKKREYIDINLKMIDQGFEYYTNNKNSL